MKLIAQNYDYLSVQNSSWQSKWFIALQEYNRQHRTMRMDPCRTVPCNLNGSVLLGSVQSKKFIALLKWNSRHRITRMLPCRFVPCDLNSSVLNDSVLNELFIAVQKHSDWQGIMTVIPCRMILYESTGSLSYRRTKSVHQYLPWMAKHPSIFWLNYQTYYKAHTGVL